MKWNRPVLVIGFVGTLLLTALFAVCAQDRSGFAPPTVLPPEPAKDKSTAKYPHKAQPLPKKTKGPDPTLIVPAEVYDVPRVIVPPVEIKPDVVPASGQLPAPAPPAVMPAVLGPKDGPPPPLPVFDTKPLPPPVIPEPTKALIADLPTMEAPKNVPFPVPPPAREPEPKKVTLPTIDAAKKDTLVIPPPTIDLEPKKNSLPAPVVIPATLQEKATPKNEVPVPVPSPALEPEPKKNSGLPSVIMPSPKQDPVVTMPPQVIGNDSPAVEKPKSFIRIRAGGGEPTPIPTPGPVVREPVVPLPLPVNPTPLPKTEAGTLANVQTPAVVVEKHGPASLRAGETQLYHLTIRNTGSVAAQQIRIEDDIPASVRLLGAEPAPQMQGSKAIWTLPSLEPGASQALRLTIKADVATQLTSSLSVHVAAANVVTRAANAPSNFTIRLTGPERVSVGKPVVFDIHVSNPTRQALTGIVLHGELSDGLTTPAGNRIEGDVNDAIAPGDFKILKMPATAVKPGRYTVAAKVVTPTGEASATANIEITADALLVQPAAMTRLALGRDGDLRIDLTNSTSKPLRNITVATLLPEGMLYIGASDRGLYQSNSRTVHWLLDNLAVGASKTLVVRVSGSKAGQFQNPVSVRADGIAEVRASGSIVLEGVTNLGLRVIERDNPLEVGRDTVYEIIVQNPGSAPATNVQVEAQFPVGLLPKSAQGAKHTLDRQKIVFDPIGVIAPEGQAVLRVSAQAQTPGNDQRVRFAVVSDEVRTPVQREVSVLVYSGK